MCGSGPWTILRGVLSSTFVSIIIPSRTGIIHVRSSEPLITSAHAQQPPVLHGSDGFFEPGLANLKPIYSRAFATLVFPGTLYFTPSTTIYT